MQPQRSREVNGHVPALSILELATVQEGSHADAALAAVTALARRADELGFRRFWLAEHHGYRSVGSVAPAVLAAQIAATTSRIRVGSGGVLLPHHAPLVVAEQFATLAALHRGRVDLGIGRGPGTTDDRVIHALRSGTVAAGDAYHADLAELLEYLAGDAPIRPLPGLRTTPEPWLLSSSVAGAQLAGQMGLPLAFGHHIRPANTVAALTRYRDCFRPSRWREHPYVMVSVETLCAPTDAEAARLGKPAALTMAAALRGNGPDAALLSADEAGDKTVPADAAERIAMLRETQAHGSPVSVAKRLARLTAQTAADELILHIPVYDIGARTRSLELTTAALNETPPNLQAGAENASLSASDRAGAGSARPQSADSRP